MTTTMMMMKTTMTMMMMIMMMTNKGIKFFSGALAREPRACLCIPGFFFFMSTNLEYRAIERQRKREIRRQASEVQREKG